MFKIKSDHSRKNIMWNTLYYHKGVLFLLISRTCQLLAVIELGLFCFWRLCLGQVANVHWPRINMNIFDSKKFVLLLFFSHDKQYSSHPLDGSIHPGKTPTMEAFKFHLATGLLLVHSHTYMVTRDAPPLSHIQTIHHKHKKTSSRAHTCM